MKKGLVLEGGGLRSLFSAGVRDDKKEHYRRHRPTEQAPYIFAACSQSSVYQHYADKNDHETRDLGLRQFFPEDDRGQDHDDRRAGVVKKRCKADADLLICFIKEHPACTHRHTGENNKQRIPSVFFHMKSSPAHKEQDDQQSAADHCPEKYDLIAVQRDVTGNNAIQAKEQQSGKIFRKSSPVNAPVLF